jgi:hypothetical protein
MVSVAGNFLSSAERTGLCGWNPESAFAVDADLPQFKAAVAGRKEIEPSAVSLPSSPGSVSRDFPQEAAAFPGRAARSFRGRIEA